MKALFQKFLAAEEGATAIEYGLIASLIALAVITAATATGTKLASTFNNISGNLK